MSESKAVSKKADSHLNCEVLLGSDVRWAVGGATGQGLSVGRQVSPEAYYLTKFSQRRQTSSIETGEWNWICNYYSATEESLEEKHKGVSMGDTEVLLRAIEKSDYRSVGQQSGRGSVLEQVTE